MVFPFGFVDGSILCPVFFLAYFVFIIRFFRFHNENRMQSSKSLVIECVVQWFYLVYIHIIFIRLKFVTKSQKNKNIVHCILIWILNWMNKCEACRDWCCQNLRHLCINIFSAIARNALYTLSMVERFFSIAHHHFSVRLVPFDNLYPVCIPTSQKHLKMLVVVSGTTLNSSR